MPTTSMDDYPEQLDAENEETGSHMLRAGVVYLRDFIGGEPRPSE